MLYWNSWTHSTDYSELSMLVITFNLVYINPPCISPRYFAKGKTTRYQLLLSLGRTWSFFVGGFQCCSRELELYICVEVIWAVWSLFLYPEHILPFLNVQTYFYQLAFTLSYVHHDVFILSSYLCFLRNLFYREVFLPALANTWEKYPSHLLTSHLTTKYFI